MNNFLKVLDEIKSTGIMDLLILIVSPFLIKWANQASHAAKNQRVVDAYNTMAQLAKNAVAYASTDYEASSTDKRTRAIYEVTQGLHANGIHISASRIDSAVEAAYQHLSAVNTKAMIKHKDVKEGNLAVEQIN